MTEPTPALPPEFAPGYDDQTTPQGNIQIPGAIVAQPTLTQEDGSRYTALHFAMLDSMRKWGLWLLVLGVVQIVASNFLDPTWGLLLLIVGALSFVAQHPALFVVYGVTLAWAAISNVLNAFSGASGAWGAYALIQVYFAFTTFKAYATYRRNEENYTQWTREQEMTLASSRVPGRAFPVAGCAVSVLSAVFAVAFFVMAIIFPIEEGAEAPRWGMWIMGAAINTAVLGLSFALASLLSRFRFKPLSILAMIGACIIIVGYVLLIIA